MTSADSDIATPMLVEAARRTGRLTLESKILDAAAGDGATAVAIAAVLFADPRNAGLDEAARVANVLDAIRLADRTPRGARRAMVEWARGHGVDVDEADVPISFGDPLSFSAEPVQGLLFEETNVPRPPAAFEQGPYDLVVADVPRQALPADRRASLRDRFQAAAGRFSYEAPFIERLLHLVHDDGIVALRVRTAALRRDFAKQLVEDVLAQTEITAFEQDGDDVVLVLRPGGTPSGAALIRAFGSEDAARVLRAVAQASASTLIEQLQGPVGRTSTPGCDDIWEPPARLLPNLPTVAMVRGEDLEPWRAERVRKIVWPYDAEGRRLDPPPAQVVEWLARFRTVLERRRFYGESMERRGLRWFDYLEHHPGRWRHVPTLVLARNGTQPRCVIARSPIVVSGSAVSATPSAAEDAPMLAGLLNSSIGCFWFKHAFHVYETSDGMSFEVTAQGLGEFPVPIDGLDDIRQVASTLDRLGRSLGAVRDAIDGEPERLEARLDALVDGNARIRREIEFWSDELDWAAYAAYGIAPTYRARSFASVAIEDADAIQGARRDWMQTSPSLRLLESREFKTSAADPRRSVRDAVAEWLVDEVDRGFAQGELPRDRPVPASEIADWLRSRALARRCLRLVAVATEDLLLSSSVPFEPTRLFSRPGLERLARWAQGEPEPFGMGDFAAVDGEVPAESASQHQRRVWALRGRFNVPRERFIHLAELSERLERPFFAWAGASDRERSALADRVADGGEAAQLDLERLLQMRTAFASGKTATTAQIADALWAQGWTYREVRLALSVLEQGGSVRQRRGRWRLVT